MTYYKQCRLGKGILRTVAWLPEQFAKLNKYVELQLDDGWSNGWKVLSISKIRLSENVISARSQDYKKTREASDI